MKVRIEIDTKTFVRFWAVVIGFALAGLAIYSAKDALIIIGISFFLALALNRPVGALAGLLPGKSRVGGTALAYVAVVALLVSGIFLVIPPIIQQTAKFAVTVPGLVETATRQWEGVNNFIQEYNLQPQVDKALTAVQDNATEWATNAGTNIVNSVGSVANFIFTGFLVLVLSFLMLLEGPRFMNWVWSVYTRKDLMERHKQLASKMYNVVTGYVTGQLTISAISSVIIGLFVFVLSLIVPEIRANLVLPAASVYFLFALIPMFGSIFAGFIITLLLVLSNIPAAIAFLVFYLVYQQVENNIIAPTVQSKTLDLSGLTVLAAATIGLYMFGIAGGIIAIPIAGIIKLLIEEFIADRKATHEKTHKATALSKVVKKLRNNSETTDAHNIT